MTDTGRVPRFKSRAEAAAWYAGLPSHDAGVPGRAFPLHTTWRDVEKHILAFLRVTPRWRSTTAAGAGGADTCPALGAVPVYRGAQWNPDAGVNTLRYLFFHTRCGIWVSVRRGAVALFAPFANEAYRNHYGTGIRLTADNLTVAQYSADKSKALRRQAETLLPSTQAWWLNGGILDNVAQPGVWGEQYLSAIKDMLDSACARAVSQGAPVPDCDFCVNKRDYPQLRRELGKEPYQAFIGTDALAREAYSAYVPVFSFYTGATMADIAMPTTEDWSNACQACFAPGSTPFLPLPLVDGDGDGDGDGDARRDARAVFRGTASGHGVTVESNIRLRLAAFGSSRPDLVDAGVTGYNFRDKVVELRRPIVEPHGRGDCEIVVDYLRTRPARVAFMSMAEQMSRYAFILYADGHCAASRYGSLMHGSAAILRVKSDMDDTAGRVWLFETSVVGQVSRDGTTVDIPHDADALLIDSSLDNLEATILYLRRNDDVRAGLVRHANMRAPTEERILAYWDAKLRAVAAVEAGTGLSPEGRGRQEWFSSFEPAYARIGRTSQSQRMTAV